MNYGELALPTWFDMFCGRNHHQYEREIAPKNNPNPVPVCSMRQLGTLEQLTPYIYYVVLYVLYVLYKIYSTVHIHTAYQAIIFQ